MITIEDCLLTVKRATRHNNVSFEVSFDNSLDASRFEVAFHAALEAAQAKEEEAEKRLNALGKPHIPNNINEMR